MNKRKEIYEQIAKLQKALNAHELTDNPPIIPLESISVDDKVKFFDDLYREVLSLTKTAIENEYWDDDIDVFVYEAAFPVLNPIDGDSLWDWKVKTF